MSEDVLRRMKEEARKLVSGDDVKYVIGYEADPVGVTPCFAETEEDVDRFVWSPLCVHNLVTYLTLCERPPLPRGVEPDTRKTGIVVKGCDARALIQILQEKGTTRDRVAVIGVPCKGTVDMRKLEPKLKEAGADLSGESASATWKDDKIVIKAGDKEYEFSLSDVVADKCLTCKYPTPLIYDVLVGDEIKGPYGEENYEDVSELEQLPLGERWEFWEKELEKCIRCYACRNVCPLCYCEECRVQSRIDWVWKSVNLPENMMYHIMRALHLAGRCVGCNECERVCPVDIPLHLLNKKLEKDVKELFDYESGIDPEGEPILAAYCLDDPEDFIR